jgi:hypothetical protein
MLNFLLDHLPVFINVDCRASTACDAIILSPLTRTAIVKWQSGSVGGYPCRRRDMLPLMFNRDLSRGQWANRTLLQDHQTVTL